MKLEQGTVIRLKTKWYLVLDHFSKVRDDSTASGYVIRKWLYHPGKDHPQRMHEEREYPLVYVEDRLLDDGHIVEDEEEMPREVVLARSES